MAWLHSDLPRLRDIKSYLVLIRSRVRRPDGSCYVHPRILFRPSYLGTRLQLHMAEPWRCLSTKSASSYGGVKGALTLVPHHANPRTSVCLTPLSAGRTRLLRTPRASDHRWKPETRPPSCQALWQNSSATGVRRHEPDARERHQHITGLYVCSLPHCRKSISVIDQSTLLSGVKTMRAGEPICTGAGSTAVRSRGCHPSAEDMGSTRGPCPTVAMHLG
ncbi:hypothetical protein F4780DRAFT_394599 [Xylariomycetidae sp. FL0641]|nr:hypothetical protein F4780DRAFT_394599 [Xylariomycetidae sp. FL0641]